MKIIKPFFALVAMAIILPTVVSAQRIKSENFDYKYVQLPLKRLDKSITNYQSVVYPEYLKENEIKKAAYEKELLKAQQDFDQAKAEYPALVAKAEADYEAEMKAWKEKSLASKVVEKQILNENNKPVKRSVSQPYLRTVSMPDLETEYDCNALASTYIKLDGFQNNAANALKIFVTLMGYENTSPRTVTEVKRESTVNKGVTTTSDVTYYRTEFTYRHPMSVKVTDAAGNQILFLTPSQLNDYKKYVGPQSKTNNSGNFAQLVKTKEEEILQQNLNFISDLVNDEIGFRERPRVAKFYYIKENKGTYEDLFVAMNEANSGLKMLIADAEAGKAKINNAIAAYESAMKESDPENKKARIDADVTTALHFNLLECYFATGKLDKMEGIMSILNTLKLSNDEKKAKEEFEMLIIDTKKRLKANS